MGGVLHSLFSSVPPFRLDHLYKLTPIQPTTSYFPPFIARRTATASPILRSTSTTCRYVFSHIFHCFRYALQMISFRSIRRGFQASTHNSHALFFSFLLVDAHGPVRLRDLRQGLQDRVRGIRRRSRREQGTQGSHHDFLRWPAHEAVGGSKVSFTKGGGKSFVYVWV